MVNDVSVSREITAPAEHVWKMVSDVTRMGEWSPETHSAVWLGGATGPAVGAKFRGSNSHGKKSWKTVCRVDACDTGRRFAFRCTAGPLAVADWTYDFVDTPDGCRVTETWTDQRGRLVMALSGIASGVKDRAVHNRAGMERTLEMLAAAAESSRSEA